MEIEIQNIIIGIASDGIGQLHQGIGTWANGIGIGHWHWSLTLGH